MLVACTLWLELLGWLGFVVVIALVIGGVVLLDQEFGVLSAFFRWLSPRQRLREHRVKKAWQAKERARAEEASRQK